MNGLHFLRYFLQNPLITGHTTAASNRAARVREEAVTDGSSSGETTFRHHKASLNAMSKVGSHALTALRHP